LQNKINQNTKIVIKSDKISIEPILTAIFAENEDEALLRVG